MTEITVSLPDPINQFVEAEAAALGFASPREYVEHVVCRACASKARPELEAKLLEGLDALDRGDAEEMTAEDWAEIRADVEKAFREKKTG